MAAAKKTATKGATKTTTKTTATKPAAKTTLTPDPVPAPAPVHTPVSAGAPLGFFDVATVERSPWGILALVFNIIPGGVGTIIAGAKVSSTGQIVKGILQLIIPIAGWIWSVIDGIRMFTRSTQ